MNDVGPNACGHEAAHFRGTFAWRTDEADRDELERLTSWAEALCKENVVTLDFADKESGPNLRLVPVGRGESLFQLYNYHDKGRRGTGQGIYLYSQSHVGLEWEQFMERWFSKPYDVALLERVKAAAKPQKKGLRIESPTTAVLTDVAELVRLASRSTCTDGEPRGSRTLRTNPYRPKDENVQISGALTWEHDPDKIDRGTGSHRRLQNELARFAAENGLQPEDRGNIDVAWLDRGILVLVEVKSTTPQNETKQLRLGLGQVLDYQDAQRTEFGSVRAVLAIEHPPSDTRWIDLCGRCGVKLVWPETFRSLFE